MARVRRSMASSSASLGSLLEMEPMAIDGLRLPVIPIRDNVYLPNMNFSLLLGRERSIRALEHALADGDRHVVLATQRDLEQEDPAFAAIHRVGVVAEVISSGRLPDGMMRVALESLHRVRILDWSRRDPYIEARVARLDETDASREDLEIDALCRAVAGDFENLVGEGRTIPPEALVSVVGCREPGLLSDTVLSYLSVSIERKQRMLEETDVRNRLRMLVSALADELRVLEIQREIRSQVEKEVGDNQREFLLREQLKAIQAELGERDAGAEVVLEYRRRLETAGMPESTRRAAAREVDRLARTPAAAPESGLLRNYLDALLDFPWSATTDDAIALEEAARVLGRDHFGLEEVKERILDFLAVRRLAGAAATTPVLCFAGPPGVGKTSLARSVADALGRRFVRVSLGGVRDEAEIRGHRRTYVGAMPGRIVRALKQAGVRNPVVLLDEIDKMGGDHRGDPAAALLEVLDPEQNSDFVDHYLEVSVDLTDVLFIATANLLDPLPPALRDRLEVIRFDGYTESEKTSIARKHLLPKQRVSHGLTEETFDLDEAALLRVVREYTREAGVRQLERRIEALCRKSARLVAEGCDPGSCLGPAGLESIIGHPTHRWGMMGASDQVGTATGLAYTESGGDIISVEVETVSAHSTAGGLMLTGHLGNVMRESAQAAWTYVRSRSTTLGIPEASLAGRDVHVHVPAAAVPKDGPSAGATMAVAMASALTGRKVRRDVAMTGELTLRGKVLGVGGIKEKVLAAHRAGIGTVALPAENRGDLESLPPDVRSAIEFKLVEEMSELFSIALMD